MFQSIILFCKNLSPLALHRNSFVFKICLWISVFSKWYGLEICFLVLEMIGFFGPPFNRYIGTKYIRYVLYYIYHMLSLPHPYLAHIISLVIKAKWNWRVLINLILSLHIPGLRLWGNFLPKRRQLSLTSSKILLSGFLWQRTWLTCSIPSSYRNYVLLGINHHNSLQCGVIMSE